MLGAPSLGGESFGMVLTEAFAAGTPVVASRHRGLPRRGQRRRGRRARPARRRDGAGGDAAATWRSIPPARTDCALAARLSAEPVRLAARGRAGRGGLRGRGRGRRSRAASMQRVAVKRRRAAAPTGQPRMGAHRRCRASSRRLTAAAARSGVGARDRPGRALWRSSPGVLAGSFFALQRIGLARIGHALVRQAALGAVRAWR